jgi:hypothetical protein
MRRVKSSFSFSPFRRQTSHHRPSFSPSWHEPHEIPSRACNHLWCEVCRLIPIIPLCFAWEPSSDARSAQAGVSISCPGLFARDARHCCLSFCPFWPKRRKTPSIGRSGFFSREASIWCSPMLRGCPPDARALSGIAPLNGCSSSANWAYAGRHPPFRGRISWEAIF